jgi:hypothetical protein
VTLGGAAVVFQVDRRTLLELVQQLVPLQGRSMIPPFRLSTAPPPPTPLNPRPVPSLDVIAGGVDLALAPGTDRGHLLLKLATGVLRVSGRPALVVQGGILDVELQLVKGTLLVARKLGASFRDLQLAGLPDASGLMAQANAEADRLLDGERGADVELLPDPPGAAASPLKVAAFVGSGQVTDPETYTMLLGAPPGATAPRLIQPGRSVALGQSAESIERTILEPALRSQLLNPNNPNADLPPPWGTGTLQRESDLSGIKGKVYADITRLDIGFADGHLEITGRFDAHGRCWSVHDGRFAQWMFLDFVPGIGANPPMLVPRMDPASPNIACSVDVDFLCQVGVVLVTGALGAMIYGLAVVAAVEVVKSGFKPAMQGVSLAPVPLAAPIGSTHWVSLQVIPEGAIAQGDILVTLPAPAALAPAVYLAVTSSVELTGAVEGQAEVRLCGPPRVFEYTEYGQIDSQSLEAKPSLLFEPIDYRWSVNGTPLTERQGTLSYAGTVRSALPLPGGTAIEDHTIELAYAIGVPSLFGEGYDQFLDLTPRDADGNYDVTVEVRATDAAGRSAGDAVTLKVVGDRLELGPDYDAYVADCMRQARDQVDRKGTRSVKPKPGEPNERLPDIVAHILDHVREGNAEVHALVEAAVVAHGAEAVAGELALQASRLGRGVGTPRVI